MTVPMTVNVLWCVGARTSKLDWFVVNVPVKPPKSGTPGFLCHSPNGGYMTRLGLLGKVRLGHHKHPKLRRCCLELCCMTRLKTRNESWANENHRTELRTYEPGDFGNLHLRLLYQSAAGACVCPSSYCASLFFSLSVPSVGTSRSQNTWIRLRCGATVRNR